MTNSTCRWRSATVRCINALLFACLTISGSLAASDPAWDTYSDTWVGVDGLGRQLPTYEDVGPPRPDRQVVIMWEPWVGSHSDGHIYDNSKIMAQDPLALQHPESALWGPLHAFHYWGEPLFGYYRDDDPFILCKHAQMISDARHRCHGAGHHE